MLTVRFERLDLKAGESVLDLGCGGGRHAFECLRRGARVVALDADGEELKKVSAMTAAMDEEGEVGEGGLAISVRATALELPFGDESFDRVIAAEVLEHIPADGRAMRELARVLRPGGRIAVTVPRYGPEVVNWALSSEYHEVDGGHVRIYRRSQLERRLRDAGLTVLGHHHAHGLHSPYWWLKCLVGLSHDQNLLVTSYHRLLVHDIMCKSPLTKALEAALNPLVGKSLVVYAERST